MSRHLASHPALPILTVLALLLAAFVSLALPARVAAQTQLVAELSGANEVPDPGDPDGAGFAGVLVHPEAGEVCAFIEVADIATATAAHIHAGAAGVAGDIVVTLPTPNAEGFVEGCVDGLDAATLQAIVDDPAGYYVNVHNAEFPDGALRGQLEPAPPPPIELFAELSGANEVPGPGDDDGIGFASVAIFLENSELCAFLDVDQIAPATAAHIHEGEAGVAGDIVVTLPTPNEEGVADGCIDGLEPALLDAIVANPSNYYVNVHNADFPLGAIRGQLSDDPPAPPACDPGELCQGLLPPGTYTYTEFGTDLTFTTATEYFAFLFDIPALALDEGSGGIFMFPFAGGVFADPCDFESDTTIGDSPSDVIGWLADRPFLSATTPTAVTYGGASGVQVDITSVTLPEECVEPPWVLLFALPVVGDFHFEEGSVARVVALDVAGETILVIIESFPGGNPAEILARGQAVLDSFVWALGTDGGGTPPASPSPSPAPLPDTAVEPPAGPMDAPWLLGVWALAGASVIIGRRIRAPSSNDPRDGSTGG